MKRLLVAAALLVLTPLVLWGLFERGFLRFNYPSLADYPIQGVDVSHHQQRIAWQQLSGPKVTFAYIKASEGASFRDQRLRENWEGALGAGILPGAYHFFTLCVSGADQGKNFSDAIAELPGPQLAPVVDLEFGGNCKTTWDSKRINEEIRAFLAVVQSSTNCTPMLYVTSEFYNAHVAGMFPGNPLWVRDVYQTPHLGGAQWTLWQFANRGRMPGVETFIDLNVFNGTAFEFSRFRCSRASTRPK